jgi:hypothetical protein
MASDPRTAIPVDRLNAFNGWPGILIPAPDVVTDLSVALRGWSGLYEGHWDRGRSSGGPKIKL